MKKNVRQFILLTTLAAGTIHIVNRFITTTAEMKNILTTAKADGEAELRQEGNI